MCVVGEGGGWVFMGPDVGRLVLLPIDHYHPILSSATLPNSNLGGRGFLVCGGVGGQGRAGQGRLRDLVETNITSYAYSTGPWLLYKDTPHK